MEDQCSLIPKPRYSYQRQDHFEAQENVKQTQEPVRFILLDFCHPPHRQQRVEHEEKPGNDCIYKDYEQHDARAVPLSQASLLLCEFYLPGARGCGT
ncbi:hypothetical protein NDU88_010858 [Pleurodeles waltl]|uniref:Uncharacterized protein n=1 Tax=Pleurodeles waltl TaxID=8319 RepID=A0AAV7R1R3_PLEWA|nr:hypothetical protein NDU88_010858 [Pleurodeles waltl]